MKRLLNTFIGEEQPVPIYREGELKISEAKSQQLRNGFLLPAYRQAGYVVEMTA